MTFDVLPQDWCWSVRSEAVVLAIELLKVTACGGGGDDQSSDGNSSSNCMCIRPSNVSWNKTRETKAKVRGEGGA